jgi:uncharacterized protein YukJ
MTTINALKTKRDEMRHAQIRARQEMTRNEINAILDEVAKDDKKVEKGDLYIDLKKEWSESTALEHLRFLGFAPYVCGMHKIHISW